MATHLGTLLAKIKVNFYIEYMSLMRKKYDAVGVIYIQIKPHDLLFIVCFQQLLSLKENRRGTYSQCEYCT